MKKLLTVLFTFLAVVLLVACKPTPDPIDPDPIDPDPVDPTNNGELVDFSAIYGRSSEIKVWIDDENGEYMEAIIAEFNKIYPNIVVKHTHRGSVESRELLKTYGPSGNGADVFQFPHDHLAQAILEDLVYPLPTSTKTLLEARAHELGLNIATLWYDETNGSFDPSSPNAVERLYAVPMSIESVGLYYNKDLVETPHTTFEALFAAADVWNAAENADDPTRTNAEAGRFYLATASHWADSYFMQFAYSAFGFYPFGPNLDDPSAVGFANAASALAWARNELKPRTTGGLNHNGVTGAANFEGGKIPYIISGPWSHEAYRAADLNYGVAPIPTINGNDTQTFAGAMMAAVYKDSDNKEDAIRFVEFLNSDIAMQLQYEMKNKLPALKTELLENIDGVVDDALLYAMAQQLETSVPMPTIPQVTHYWGPGETMLINVWNTTMTIAEATAAAEQSYRVRVGLSTGE